MLFRSIEPVGLAELQENWRRASLRRELGIAAAVLWLSGLIWLMLATQYRWLGWLQMCAAILGFVRMRTSRLQKK